MKYKFIGKPDRIFPNLETGKVYDLEIREIPTGFIGWVFGAADKIQIISPIICPYSSWRTFRQNWEPLNNQSLMGEK